MADGTPASASPESSAPPPPGPQRAIVLLCTFLLLAWMNSVETAEFTRIPISGQVYAVQQIGCPAACQVSVHRLFEDGGNRSERRSVLAMVVNFAFGAVCLMVVWLLCAWRASERRPRTFGIKTVYVAMLAVAALLGLWKVGREVTTSLRAEAEAEVRRHHDEPLVR